MDSCNFQDGVLILFSLRIDLQICLSHEDLQASGPDPVYLMPKLSKFF